MSQRWPFQLSKVKISTFHLIKGKLNFIGSCFHVFNVYLLYCYLINLLPAPRIDFVQVDFNSTQMWDEQKFCKDKELYVMDLNADNK